MPSGSVENRDAVLTGRDGRREPWRWRRAQDFIQFLAFFRRAGAALAACSRRARFRGVRPMSISFVLAGITILNIGRIRSDCTTCLDALCQILRSFLKPRHL